MGSASHKTYGSNVEGIVMDTKVLDVRAATCPGGGAMWAFLSHLREIPRGGTMELLTDDPIARTDIPECVRQEGWTLLAQELLQGYSRFVMRRPS